MSKKIPIFYSAMLLTAVNLLLRLAGTSFQVYLSGRIGAEGIGLLQLVMSVGSLAMVIGMAGIRTATMYLAAEERGRGTKKNLPRVLSGCICYSLICSAVVAVAVSSFSPILAGKWIGNPNTEQAIRLIAVFLPVNCLCAVLVGFFTGINKIKTLAAVEIAEQICSMACTIMLLHFWAGRDPYKACLAVILGSGTGACLTLSALTLLRLMQRQSAGTYIPVASRLLRTAVPLALADNLRTGISTVENLMVPKRLALFPGTVSALASFGIVCGMVFPILTFPMAILFGLTELIIPELARCNAAGSTIRIQYLVKKCLRIALLFGALCSGILYLCADSLCLRLYSEPLAGTYLKWFAPLAIMLYCDSMTDAMIKGLGEQKISVLFNIITNIMDVVLLFVLLPKYGIAGYFLSFLVTHLINFILSLRHLLRISKIRIDIRTPVLTVICTVVAVIICSHLKNGLLCAVAFSIILLCGLYLLGIVRKEDALWLAGLVAKEKAGQCSLPGK